MLSSVTGFVVGAIGEQAAGVAQVLQRVARALFQTQRRVVGDAAFEQCGVRDLRFAGVAIGAAAEQDDHLRRAFAPQLRGALQARVEIGVDAALRRMFAEQQQAAAVVGRAGRTAGDARHMQKIADVDQPRGQHARAARDETGVQHVGVEEQTQAVIQAAQARL